MGAKAQDHLLERFHNVIDYFRKEYDITYIEVLGAIAVMRRGIEDEVMEQSEASEPEDEDSNPC